MCAGHRQVAAHHERNDDARALRALKLGRAEDCAPGSGDLAVVVRLMGAQLAAHHEVVEHNRVGFQGLYSILIAPATGFQRS